MKRIIALVATAAISSGGFGQVRDTPLAVIPYGALQSSFASADLIAGGRVISEDSGCGAGAEWRSWSDAKTCISTIRLVRVYKGDETGGSAVALNYTERSPDDLLTRNVASGQYAVFVLCRSGSSYSYCEGDGFHRAFITASNGSHDANSQSGIDLLISDLLAGLHTSDINDQEHDATVLWALGSAVESHLDAIRAAAHDVAMPARVDLEALLIRSDPDNCGADLSFINQLPQPYTANLPRIAGALHYSGVRCLSQVSFLANSSLDPLRYEAVRIIENAHSTRGIPVLLKLLDDSDPGVAFNAAKTLANVTGNRFADRPAFADFSRKPEVRSAYVQEWKGWARSQGYAPMK